MKIKINEDIRYDFQTGLYEIFGQSKIKCLHPFAKSNGKRIYFSKGGFDINLELNN